MIIWFLFAILTVAAALAVLVPLTRGRPQETAEGEAGSAAAPDVAIYKDQLDEIERDVERGVMNPEEAEAARTEIARRLIRASHSADERAPAKAGSGRARAAAAIAIVGLPAVTLGLYLTLGSPLMPDAPLSARLQPAQDGFQQFQDLVAKVEQRLAEKPEDGRGWDVVAPAYMRLGRAQDAATAYANAIRLLGETAPRRANQGEAIVAANNGVVTADARAAFERAEALAPKAVKPRFYLAMGLSQEGKTDEAVAAWKALLAEADGTEPWVPVAHSELRKLGADMSDGGRIAGASGDGAPQAGGLPGPSAADVQAAGELSTGDRQDMIRSMVARLDERLKTEGGSVEEWARLVRAYGVLGDEAKVRDALQRAHEALKDDPGAYDRLVASFGPGMPGTAPQPAAPQPAIPQSSGDMALPGPSAGDVAAANDLSAGDRQQMVAGMVSRLDERLKSEGGTAQEWSRLMRSYVVLGRREEAEAALKRARTDLAGNDAGLAAVNAVAAELGLGA